MRKKKLLSVIVPAYRQARTIKSDLENIQKTLDKGLKGYDYEIICVVDGKLDTTRENARKFKHPKVKVFGYKYNKGKGYAVRYGMVRSKGDLISFIDAGMEISPASIMMLMSHMQWYEADIIVGSKRHPVSRVNYPFLRRVYSIGYHIGVKLLFGLMISDTQSGIKVFKRSVLEKVLPRLLVKRYAMDIEMLAVANRLGYKNIYEAPIEVQFDQSTSSVRWKTVFKMLWDTLAVFYRLRILKYYDNGNERKWVYDKDLEFRINVG